MRFEAKEVGEVVCLYDPVGGQPPGALAHVQGVPVEAGALQHQLLAPVLRTPWKVSDDWLIEEPLLETGRPGDGKIQAAATVIADAFADARRMSYYPCHRVVLDLSKLEDFDIDDGIPAEAAVVAGRGATESYTLALFGAAEAPGRTWGDLLDGVEGKAAPWREKLDQQFAAACRHQLFEPAIEPFPNWFHDRLYRPFLSRVEVKGRDERPQRVTILLVRDNAPPKIGGPAFNVLRSNTRYRTEVFDVFGTDVGQRLEDAEDDAGRVYRMIGGAFARVEAEAEALGVFTETGVRAAYGNEYDASGVRDLEQDWLAAREDFMTALEERDRVGVEKGLGRLAELNQHFTALAAERYRKLVVGEA